MSVDRGRVSRFSAGLTVCAVMLLFTVYSRAEHSEPASLHSCSVAAYDLVAVSLAQAVDLALCNNAELQSGAAGIRLRAAQLGGARAEYWPVLRATTSTIYERTELRQGAEDTTSDSALTVFGAATWKLFDFGERSSRVRAASKLLEAALSTRDATVQRVLARVVENYFDAVTAKGLLQSNEEDRGVASDTVAAAQRRLDHGNGTQSDVFQAQVAFARESIDWHRARAAYQKAIATLIYTLGLSPHKQLEISDEGIDARPDEEQRSLADWLKEAQQLHPAIEAARADVDAAQAQVRSARASGMPSVDFQANYFANGFPQEGLDATRQRSTTVGIAVSIPLFDGFLNRYRVREAEASLNIKEVALVDTERVTLTEIIRAYSDASESAANLQNSAGLLEAATQSHAASKRRYDGGAADIVELLNAQRMLSDARQERVRSVAEWRSARLRLLATSGLLTDRAF